LIEKLKKLFTASEQQTPEESEKSIRLACLVMMLETAKADHAVDGAELSAIEAYAEQHFHLEKTTVKTLVKAAKEKADHATSLYEFTSLINENFDETKKFQVIQSMWRVAYADGRIDRYEEHIIRRAADLLYVSHPRFIEAKLSVKPHG